MDDHHSLDLYTPSYRLPCLSRRIAFALGHVLNDFGRTLWLNFALIFLVAVIKLTHFQVGFIILAGQLVGLVSSIFFDYIESRRNICYCWYTKRKSWHLCGTILVLVSTVMIFMKCIGCSHDEKWIQAVYYGALVAIFHVGWSAIQSSHLGMIPEITRNPHERIELGAIRYIFGVVASLIVFAVLWLLFSLSGTPLLDSEDHIWFRTLAITLAVAGGIASFIFHLGTDEHGFDLFLEANLSTVSYERMTWRQWLQQPKFYLVSAIHTLLRVSANLATIYLPLYLFYTLKLHKVYIAAVPLASYLAKIFIPFATRPFGSCTSPKVTVIIGSVLVAGAGVWSWFIKDSWSLHEIHVIGMAILMGAGSSTACVSALDVVQRLLGDKTETGAFVYGSLSALDKALTGVAVVIIQTLYKEFDSQMINKGIDYYRCIFAVVACLAALALLVHFALLPQNLSILRGRGEIFTRASIEHDPGNQGDCSMKPFETTASEDCFNYWSCLSTSNETEAHYVAVTFNSPASIRDQILPSIGGSVNTNYSPFTASVFETNRRSHSYESIEALRSASSLRSIQSAPNFIEYSGNHERPSDVRTDSRPKTGPSIKDNVNLLENEELPEPTMSKVVRNEASAEPHGATSTPVTVHVPSQESGHHDADNEPVASSPYDNV